MTKTPGLGGIGRALGNRDFRLYWLGGVASILGSWIQRLALGWLTWELTGSTAMLGTIALVTMAPIVVLAPISGALADRVGAQRVIATAMFLEGCNVALVGILTATGLITVPILLTLATVQGILFGFDFPVRHALLPRLVPRQDLSAAIAVNTTSFHAGFFVGPLLGGGLIEFLGLGAAFLINAMTFFFFMFVLLSLRLRKEPAARPHDRGMMADVVHGLRYALGHPAIRLGYVMSIAGNMLLRPFMDLLPGFASQVFGRGVDGLTILMAATGLGALAAGLWIAIRGRMAGLTRLLVATSLTTALFIILFALTDNLWLGAACLVPVGMGLVITGVSTQSLVQNAVDPAVRARIIGVSVSIAIGGTAFGAVVIGSAAEVFGLGWPLAAAATIAILLVLATAPRLLRHAEQLEAETPWPDEREGLDARGNGVTLS